jgi:hypothetical protein
VAVAAIDAEFGRVVPVTEGNRLGACYVDFGEIGRSVDSIDRIAQRRQNEHRAVYAESRKGIGAAMKYLSHPDLSEFLNPTTNRKNYNTPDVYAQCMKICAGVRMGTLEVGASMAGDLRAAALEDARLYVRMSRR